MFNFIFGSDPEFMITNENRLKSAIKLLPPKENSIKDKGNEFYYDNVLAEIAIKPSFNKNEAIENFRDSLKFLSKEIFPNKIKICAASFFPEEEIDCKQAKRASCNPEYSAYTLSLVSPPSNLIEQKEDYYQFKTNLRTSGGHIHLGSDFLNDGINKINVVRMMDLFIAIPSLFLECETKSKKRRSCYGMAGTHRIPDQKGRLEYRTLSNFWLQSPEHVSLIYDLCDFVLNFVSQEKHKKFWDFDSKIKTDDVSKAHICHGYDVNALVSCINNCDKKQAEKFMIIVENFLEKEILVKIFDLIDKKNKNLNESWSF